MSQQHTALADRIDYFPASQTIAMATKARELAAKGHEVISLSLGEPDFKTPEHICEAAKQAIDEGYHGYSPVPGFADLREAIAQKFKTQNGINCQATNIVVSTGAKQSISNVMHALVNPGDEVIILAPYWVSYKAIVELVEGVPVIVPGHLENGFKATAQQVKAAITSKTKALIFSSPCNPTGAVWSKEELSELADVLAEAPHVYAISDEIYELINFTGSYTSLGSFDKMADQVITINGLAKGYAMTGWRIGYMAAPEWLAKACTKLQGQSTSGTCAIAQRAALTAITADHQPSYDMRDAFLKRRDIVVKLLTDIPGINLPETPPGAFYVFPDVSAYFGKKYKEQSIKTADDFSMLLLNEAYVSTVPGDAFGNNNCIRLSYAAF